MYDKRTTATITAALRFYHWNYRDALANPHILNIADQADTVKPLDADEIDALCIDLNLGGPVDDPSRELAIALDDLLRCMLDEYRPGPAKTPRKGSYGWAYRKAVDVLRKWKGCSDV